MPFHRREIDENWRPDVLDLAALHEAWGASKKQSNADLHLYCWMNFGKASTKELTWEEYQRVLTVQSLPAEFEQRPEESM